MKPLSRSVLLGFLVPVVLWACASSEPCADGFEGREDGRCYELPPDGDTGDLDGDEDSGGDEGGGDDTAEVPDAAWLALVEDWHEANESIYEGLGYTAWDNRGGILSQNEDAVMQAILSMYRATGDLALLQLFVVHGDKVLAWRDDNVGYTDYSGASNPVWSDANENYVRDGEAYGFLLESGQLGFPLADFGQLVLNDSSLLALDAGDGRTLETVARGYVQACEETLAYHHERWHTDTVEVDGVSQEIGWFSARADADFLIGIPAGGILPVNHLSSLGRMVGALHRATGDASHLDRLQRITRWVDLELTADAGDAYVWTYWPTMPYYPAGTVDNGGNTNVEDFSHGVFTGELAQVSVDAGAGVWDDTDLARFNRTFRLNLYAGTPGVFNVLVDGTDPSSRPGDLYQVGRYLHLAAYEAGAEAEHFEIVRYTVLEQLRLQEPGMIGSATGLLSLAELIRHWELQD